MRPPKPAPRRASAARAPASPAPTIAYVSRSLTSPPFRLVSDRPLWRQTPPVARSFLGAVVDHQGDPPGVAPPGGAVPDEKRTGGLWAGRREVGRGPPPVGRACGTEAA